MKGRIMSFILMVMLTAGCCEQDSTEEFQQNPESFFPESGTLAYPMDYESAIQKIVTEDDMLYLFYKSKIGEEKLAVYQLYLNFCRTIDGKDYIFPYRIFSFKEIDPFMFDK